MKQSMSSVELFSLKILHLFPMLYNFSDVIQKFSICSRCFTTFQTSSSATFQTKTLGFEKVDTGRGPSNNYNEIIIEK